MPTPTDIKLLQKSKTLDIIFDDGNSFSLPCEYLRVFSPAAEEKPVFGKEDVNIIGIDPVGAYAVKLTFDDGHNTGIYSWETLYTLCIHHKTNWNNYLDQIKSLGELKDSCKN